MTSGEGGMVTTATPRSPAWSGSCATRGWSSRYENEVVGFNTRMTDIHAAIGRVQLGKLAGWTAQRQANAAFLSGHLEGVVTPSVAPRRGARLPPVHDPGPRSRSGCLRRGAGRARCRIRRLLPDARSRLAVVRAVARPAGDREGGQEVVSLPVHPSLSKADLDTIVEAVNAVAKAGA